MPNQSTPVPVELHGVVLAGNPVSRPRGSAERCENLRLMPGLWLRLWGGRKARINLLAEQVRFIQVFHALGFSGNDTLMLQTKKANGTCWWRPLSVANYVMDPSGFSDIAINTSHDGGHALTNAAASCPLVNEPLLYNGLGVRDTNGSAPPFTVNGVDGVQRYFGLDCYCPSGNPTAAFTAGAGYNTTADSFVEIWAGLYDAGKSHHSNAVFCGRIATNGATGTITVSSLDKIKASWASNAQKADMGYVFYATIQSGAVPYLVLAADLSGPYVVPLTSTSASLSLTSGTVNGWVLDEARQFPESNYPPRPMRSVCYSNGRVYGAPLDGGVGSPVWQRRMNANGLSPDFTYQYENTRDLAGVYWSAAIGDANRGDMLGDPMQCWPLTNFKATPNGDQPLCVVPTPDGLDTLVLTARGTYTLTEAADGIHETNTVSDTDGLSRSETVVVTRYGIVWVTQRKQLVLYKEGQSGLAILSLAYQPLLSAAEPRFCAYLLDPINEVDQVRVYLDNDTCVVHDFVMGEGYVATGQTYTAGRTAYSAAGVAHHLVANTKLYTQEGQPENGRVLTGNENFANDTDQTLGAVTYPVGVWENNWDDAGDSAAQKDLLRVDITGDGSGIAMRWRSDFSASDQATAKDKTPLSQTDCQWSYRPAGGSGAWHKMKFVVTAIASSFSAIPTYHDTPAQQGEQPRNFFGCILALKQYFDRSQSRA